MFGYTKEIQMDKDKVIELAVSVLASKVRNQGVNDYEWHLERIIRAIIEADKVVDVELKRRYNENS